MGHTCRARRCAPRARAFVKPVPNFLLTCADTILTGRSVRVYSEGRNIVVAAGSGRRPGTVEVRMKGLTRWQDGVFLSAGQYGVVSALWCATDPPAMWSLICLGVLIAAAAVAPLAGRTMDSMEYAHAALGVLLFIAPWVLGYADMMGAAWTSWIVGLISFVVGLAAIPAVRHIGGGRAAPQH